MLEHSTFASYTYYPFPHCPPDAGGQDAASFHDAVLIDFNQMKDAAVTAEARVGQQLPIVLQEVGFQSSCGTDPDGGVPAYSNHVFEAEQAAFVEGALQAFKEYNESNWIPEFDWWAGFFDNDASTTPDPSQGPFVVPRIVSYNTFMLHDWSNEAAPPTSCPFANLNDSDGTPTRRWRSTRIQHLILTEPARSRHPRHGPWQPQERIRRRPRPPSPLGAVEHRPPHPRRIQLRPPPRRGGAGWSCQ
jgi:hypothetical protein